MSMGIEETRPVASASTKLKLFVGGVPSEISSEDLRCYFEEFLGETLEEVVVKGNRDGGTARFGFLWVSGQVAAGKIMAQSHLIKGNTIAPPVMAKHQRSAIQRTGGWRASPPDPRAHRDKIFVGGLSGTTTVEHLKALFGRFGPIKDAVIMQDRVTNRSRGFGFVVFESPSSVQAAMNDQMGAGGIKLDGKTVEVKPAVPKEVLTEDSPKGGGGGGSSGFNFPEGLQYIETAMGYMPPPGASDNIGPYAPPYSSMRPGVPVYTVPQGPQGPQDQAMPRSPTYVPVVPYGFWPGGMPPNMMMQQAPYGMPPAAMTPHQMMAPQSLPGIPVGDLVANGYAPELMQTTTPVPMQPSAMAGLMQPPMQLPSAQLASSELPPAEQPLTAGKQPQAGQASETAVEKEAGSSS